MIHDAFNRAAEILPVTDKDEEADRRKMLKCEPGYLMINLVKESTIQPGKIF